MKGRRGTAERLEADEGGEGGRWGGREVEADEMPAREVGADEEEVVAGASTGDEVEAEDSSGTETKALTWPQGPERERTLARASEWASGKASRAERRSELSETVTRGASRPRRSRAAQLAATVYA